MGGVDQVSTDLDVSLVNQDSGLMNTLGLETLLIDSSLKSLVQEFIESQTQDVIEFEFFIAEETISVHSVKECSTFEYSSWVFFLEGEEFSGCLSELGEQKMNSPYFSFVLETVLSDQLQFVVDSFLFEGSSGGFEG